MQPLETQVKSPGASGTQLLVPSAILHALQMQAPAGDTSTIRGLSEITADQFAENLISTDVLNRKLKLLSSSLEQPKTPQLHNFVLKALVQLLTKEITLVATDKSFTVKLTLAELFLHLRQKLGKPLTKSIELVGGSVAWMLLGAPEGNERAIYDYLDAVLRNIGIPGGCKQVPDELLQDYGKLPSDYDFRFNVPDTGDGTLYELQQAVEDFIYEKVQKQGITKGAVHNQAFKDWFNRMEQSAQENPSLSNLPVNKYSAVGFQTEGGRGVDVVFTTQLSNESLFIQDALRIPLDALLDQIEFSLLPSSGRQEGSLGRCQEAGRNLVKKLEEGREIAAVHPLSDYIGGTGQAVIDRLLGIARPTKKDGRLPSWGRLMMAYVKGKRGQHPGADKSLMQNILSHWKTEIFFLPQKIRQQLQLAASTLKTEEQQDEIFSILAAYFLRVKHKSSEKVSGVEALSLQVCYSLRESDEFTKMQPLWKKFRNAQNIGRGDEKGAKGLFEMAAAAIDRNPALMEPALAMIEVQAYLQLCHGTPIASQNGPKAVLVMHNQEAAMRLQVGECYLLLPFKPQQAFDCLRRVSSQLSLVDWGELEKISREFTPTKYEENNTSPIERNLKLLRAANRFDPDVLGNMLEAEYDSKDLSPSHRKLILEGVFGCRALTGTGSSWIETSFPEWLEKSVKDGQNKEWIEKVKPCWKRGSSPMDNFEELLNDAKNENIPVRLLWARALAMTGLVPQAATAYACWKQFREKKINTKHFKECELALSADLSKVRPDLSAKILEGLITEKFPLVKAAPVIRLLSECGSRHKILGERASLFDTFNKIFAFIAGLNPQMRHQVDPPHGLIEALDTVFSEILAFPLQDSILNNIAHFSLKFNWDADQQGQLQDLWTEWMGKLLELNLPVSKKDPALHYAKMLFNLGMDAGVWVDPAKPKYQSMLKKLALRAPNFVPNHIEALLSIHSRRKQTNYKEALCLLRSSEFGDFLAKNRASALGLLERVLERSNSLDLALANDEIAKMNLRVNEKWAAQDVLYVVKLYLRTKRPSEQLQSLMRTYANELLGYLDVGGYPHELLDLLKGIKKRDPSISIDIGTLKSLPASEDDEPSEEELPSSPRRIPLSVPTPIVLIGTEIVPRSLDVCLIDREAQRASQFAGALRIINDVEKIVLTKEPIDDPDFFNTLRFNPEHALLSLQRICTGKKDISRNSASTAALRIALELLPEASDETLIGWIPTLLERLKSKIARDNPLQQPFMSSFDRLIAVADKTPNSLELVSGLVKGYSYSAVAVVPSTETVGVVHERLSKLLSSDSNDSKNTADVADIVLACHRIGIFNRIERDSSIKVYENTMKLLVKHGMHARALEIVPIIISLLDGDHGYGDSYKFDASFAGWIDQWVSKGVFSEKGPLTEASTIKKWKMLLSFAVRVNGVRCSSIRDMGVVFQGAESPELNAHLWDACWQQLVIQRRCQGSSDEIKMFWRFLINHATDNYPQGFVDVIDHPNYFYEAIENHFSVGERPEISQVLLGASLDLDFDTLGKTKAFVKNWLAVHRYLDRHFTPDAFVDPADEDSSSDNFEIAKRSLELVRYALYLKFGTKKQFEGVIESLGEFLEHQGNLNYCSAICEWIIGMMDLTPEKRQSYFASVIIERLIPSIAVMLSDAKEYPVSLRKMLTKLDDSFDQESSMALINVLRRQPCVQLVNFGYSLAESRMDDLQHDLEKTEYFNELVDKYLNMLRDEVQRCLVELFSSSPDPETPLEQQEKFIQHYNKLNGELEATEDLEMFHERQLFLIDFMCVGMIAVGGEYLANQSFYEKYLGFLFDHVQSRKRSLTNPQNDFIPVIRFLELNSLIDKSITPCVQSLGKETGRGEVIFCRQNLRQVRNEAAREGLVEEHFITALIQVALGIDLLITRYASSSLQEDVFGCVDEFVFFPVPNNKIIFEEYCKIVTKLLQTATQSGALKEDQKRLFQYHHVGMLDSYPDLTLSSKEILEACASIKTNLQRFQGHKNLGVFHRLLECTPTEISPLIRSEGQQIINRKKSHLQDIKAKAFQSNPAAYFDLWEVFRKMIKEVDCDQTQKIFYLSRLFNVGINFLMGAFDAGSFKGNHAKFMDCIDHLLNALKMTDNDKVFEDFAKKVGLLIFKREQNIPLDPQIQILMRLQFIKWLDVVRGKKHAESAKIAGEGLLLAKAFKIITADAEVAAQQ